MTHALKIRSGACRRFEAEEAKNDRWQTADGATIHTSVVIAFRPRRLSQTVHYTRKVQRRGDLTDAFAG